MNQDLVTRISTTAAVEKNKSLYICACQNYVASALWCSLRPAKPGRGTSAWQKAGVTLAIVRGSLENMLFSFPASKAQKGMLQWIEKM